MKQHIDLSFYNEDILYEKNELQEWFIKIEKNVLFANNILSLTM